jgi:hypothetical protein
MSKLFLKKLEWLGLEVVVNLARAHYYFLIETVLVVANMLLSIIFWTADA